MPNGKGPISKAVQTQLNDLIAENLVPQETTPAYVPPPVLVDCILGHFCTKRGETAAGLRANTKPDCLCGPLQTSNYQRKN